MITAKVSAIASALPEDVLSNSDLSKIYDDWSPSKIHKKTGIVERRIAGSNQTASDLALLAAEKLFASNNTRRTVDFLLFCSQTPDYIVPATACQLQERLGLQKSIGALDFSLGCSGFVYGLALAKGLINSRTAKSVLLLTSDTYSKIMHPRDKSTRTIFGDAATATLIDAVESEYHQIGGFIFGTDGNGAKNLMVPAGAFRRPSDSASARERTDKSGNVRNDDTLQMDGPEIMAFALRETPLAISRLLESEGVLIDDIDLFIFHQANRYVLDHLRRKLNIPPERFAIYIEECGNTISSSIPIVLEQELKIPGPRQIVLYGFGAGYSWAATRLILNPFH